MLDKINLNSKVILSSQEACKEWGVDSSTLRKRALDFPKGSIRKFGNTYVVTRVGMLHVFGHPNTEKVKGGEDYDK